MIRYKYSNGIERRGNMGTNFYFMCRDKELVQNNFAIKESWGIHSEEYEIVDEPYAPWHKIVHIPSPS